MVRGWCTRRRRRAEQDSVDRRWWIPDGCSGSRRATVSRWRRCPMAGRSWPGASRAARPIRPRIVRRLWLRAQAAMGGSRRRSALAGRRRRSRRRPSGPCRAVDAAGRPTPNLRRRPHHRAGRPARAGIVGALWIAAAGREHGWLRSTAPIHLCPHSRPPARCCSAGLRPLGRRAGSCWPAERSTGNATARVRQGVAGVSRIASC